ncbi:pilus assembly protein [Ralstonia pseudosolanacearum]|uniref:Pilus assembly protein n=1 Tax=Ralstonia solanacearum TaxID=305 RepID=A0AA92K428_RALSL|nr:TadE/TadG family type IV pilus assembly protein [Ralstonia pseudosolanacearum]QOK98120.1 pilus assembly protein [Ralstonia pseudosolanacearum]
MTPRRGTRTFKRRLRGATLAEFAVVGPLAFLLILAIVQLGFMFMARSTLNQATFMAAREGALRNADPAVIRSALVKGLIPFYQDTTQGNDVMRLSTAWLAAQGDLLVPTRLKIDILNPTPGSFKDWGVSDPSNGNRRYIPNDNLQFRPVSVGTHSKQTLMDANLLRIRVTYAYELKVPLISYVYKRVMCGGLGDGVNAFGGDTTLLDAAGPISNCIYYQQGRTPIVAYATVRMQTPAIEQ